VLLSILTVSLSLLIGAPGHHTSATAHGVAAPAGVAAGTVPASDEPASDVTQVTFNEFLPEDRGLGECISAAPKPGCGSSAQGGWRQGLVLLAILIGLALITWRVIASSRKALRLRDQADRAEGADAAT
jgi:hypothetical protein